MSFLYCVQCATCGDGMKVTHSYIDGDHDLQITVECTTCKDNIEDLESELAEAKEQDDMS